MSAGFIFDRKKCTKTILLILMKVALRAQDCSIYSLISFSKRTGRTRVGFHATFFAWCTRAKRSQAPMTSWVVQLDAEWRPYASSTLTGLYITLDISMTCFDAWGISWLSFSDMQSHMLSSNFGKNLYGLVYWRLLRLVRPKSATIHPHLLASLSAQNVSLSLFSCPDLKL